MNSESLSPLQRALISLDGLAIGDALGEMLSYRHAQAARMIAEDLMHAGPWIHTDDTEMAISIVEVLREEGRIHGDKLASLFARRFHEDPDRGYGSMTRRQMRAALAGTPWRQAAASAFGGQGSMGNGSAMRVAPLGAFFADEPARAVAEAEASSIVTHTHPEGVAGAIAVAAATTAAWQTRSVTAQEAWHPFFHAVLAHTPRGKVHDGIDKAHSLAGASADQAARELGNGSLVTAPDTVPFALWCAAQHFDDFQTAIGTAIHVGGDCDTIAAMVGGIVAVRVGRSGIPARWLIERERLPFDCAESGR